jgi:hypothetical protein
LLVVAETWEAGIDLAAEVRHCLITSAESVGRLVESGDLLGQGPAGCAGLSGS